MESEPSVHHDKKYALYLGLILFCLAVLCPTLASKAETTGDAAATLYLVRVDVSGPITDIPLPIYSDLVDGKGVPYVLSIASLEQLQQAGQASTVLDAAPSGTRYLLAASRDPQAREKAKAITDVLSDDGFRIIVRDAPNLTAALSRLGLKPRPLRSEPRSLPAPTAPRKAGTPFVKSATVQAMLDKVTSDNLSDSISGLSGDTEVTIGGEQYTITTRNTASGTPIQKASQYITEQLQALGLTVSANDWATSAYSGSNVIGEMPGVSKPAEVILMVAHLDSINNQSDDPTVAAPGADDDGSGCAALLVAAKILKGYRFERTIRFVFSTGEEQGLLGTEAYAKQLKDAGQNILDVVNLDMIAYSTQSSPIQNLHTRIQQNPGYAADLAIANLFVNVVNNYGLSTSLVPVIISDSNDEGDQYSFWDNSFPSIMVIEDDNNFNPNYHCRVNMDDLQYLNMAYETAQTKASLGTVAHLAGLVTIPAALPSTSLLLLQ
ncbi:MAG: M20/M25/M40 family metallo-hydrolase [Solidesulfovibrio sp. DCME]|uniref:M28 family metallopeptidase n=1 Tax=Solidesulfovibrio sp. DCME TaxID=3447380 RepID=UPI003D0F3094